MILGHYRLLAQLGAAADGVCYRAEDPDAGVAVEVRVLSGAQADEFRWRPLAKRLRLAALLDHPAALRVLGLALEHDPPFVALEWAEGQSLAAAWCRRVPVPPEDALALARELASALAEAHRLGLSHDRLGPGQVLLAEGRAPKLDFTGIRCRSTRDPQAVAELDASCRAPRARGAGLSDPKADLYSLGALLAWLLTGQPVSGAHREGPPAAAGGRIEAGGGSAAALQRLIRELLAAEPVERPSAREVEARLSALIEPAEDPQMQPTLDFSAGDGTETWARHTMGTSAPGRAPGPPAADDPAQRTLLVPSPSDDRDEARLKTILVPSSAGRSPAPGPSNGPYASAGPGRGEPPAPRDEPPARLGRFRILGQLGQGGMGTVYRAEDLADGTVVAIKVLRPQWARRPESLRRFHKEARLLAEVNHPYVTNLLEVNEDAGLHYLALEFVEGRSLGDLLAERGRLDEPTALAIMADVARALAGAHERGIVHRDVKPDNILVVAPEEGSDVALGATVTFEGPPPEARVSVALAAPPRVKLSDFGLARHVEESASLMMTQPDALVGTPLYMAPEQGTGGAIDARTDIYSMGVTLYHLLAGRLPFEATGLMDILAMHRTEPPPPLRKFNAAVSDGACQVVEKAMAKAPEARYADAGALLRDLERLLRGEPTSITIHPRLPEADPRQVLQFDFRWDLDASPRQLWPLVSNTDRLNQAIGLPAVHFLVRAEPGQGVRRYGQARLGGLPATWEEHPFEWVEPRRFGVLRTFDRGPLKWFVSRVELESRPGGGTTLTHRICLEPGLPRLLRAALAIQMKRGVRRSLDRVYRRIDAALTGKLGEPGLVDPFIEAPPLSGTRRQRLDRLLDGLIGRGLEVEVVERLGDYLAQAPAQEVARLRPLALARRLGLEDEAVVAACLHGARDGLLVLLWDILCPVCRIPSEVKDSLRALREHGHCPACDLDFALDFAQNVEMVFRVHPEIRDAELGTYCVGGPSHSPHVVAQVRVAPGERVELDLELPEGSYRFRGPQLPFAVEFRVQPEAPAGRWDLALSRRPGPELPRVLRAGAQVLALANDHDQELVVRVERVAPRHDALTAARASSLALFRELFADEVLSPGQLASVANVTLLVTDLERAIALYQALGDGRAFGVLHEHLRQLDERIRRAGGAVVKTQSEGVLASFSDPAAAVRVGLDLLADQPRDLADCGVRLRVGIHRGAAMVTTLNDQLDYFGTMVSQTAHLLEYARGGELVLTRPVATDPEVAAGLGPLGIPVEMIPADLPGLPGGFLHRLRISGVAVP